MKVKADFYNKVICYGVVQTRKWTYQAIETSAVYGAPKLFVVIRYSNEDGKCSPCGLFDVQGNKY